MSVWGKIIGATAGFALGGPIGAMLGIMVGGSFDRTAKRFKNSSQIPNSDKQKIFALSIIILSAKIAKADGEVTKNEIHAFKEKFNIPKSEMSEVGRIFNEAKKTKNGYKEIADQVGSLFLDNKILLEELLNNLFYIAESDGHTSHDEIKILKSISNSFGLTDKDFQRIFHSRLDDKNSDPYKVLSINRNDDDTTIRKRWIQLNKEHHPDNLIAKGLPKEFIEQSNDELSSINLAYDKIKEQRGIN
mgnify:CR=1 FL=1